MRILFAAPIDEYHAQRWIRFFADREHDVHVVSTTAIERKNAPAALGGARVHAVELGPRRSSVLSEFFTRFLPFKRKVKRLIDEITTS